MQCLVIQQVLVGSASLWGILLKCCENLFGKSTHVLLVAAGEVCSSSLQRGELLHRLLCWPCERFLKYFIRFKTLILGKQRSLEQVKRFIEESLSTIWLLKTFKAIDNLVARVLQGIWWRLDFEFCEQNPKLESGCNVWQILWLTNLWSWYLPQGNFSEYEHFFVSSSFLISQERKHKVLLFALF